MAAILARGRTERGPEVSIEAVDEELAARRGETFLRTFCDSGVLLHAWRKSPRLFGIRCKNL